jgi:hypothetical protein
MIKKYSSIFLFSMFFLAITTGCGTRMTKEEAFPIMYEKPPLSVLLLPPINESTAAEAKDFYATTIQEPLIVNGYYVYPYEISSEILKLEGVYDTELFMNAPLNKFKEYFGADAVLFTTIKKWDVSYFILASNLTVSIDCMLKSTDTNEILWKYNGTVVVDLTANNSSGGAAGLIAAAILTSINTAVADYVPYARIANYKAMESLPYGKYHPMHMKDQKEGLMKQ